MNNIHSASHLKLHITRLHLIGRGKKKHLQELAANSRDRQSGETMTPVSGGPLGLEIFLSIAFNCQR